MQASIPDVDAHVAGGRERTIGQLCELLKRSGFQPSAATETAGSSRIVEATAV
jgi:hypothetical protein